jgi:hypothetical protein
MSKGTKLGNFNVNIEEWKKRLASITDGSFITSNLNS